IVVNTRRCEFECVEVHYPPIYGLERLGEGTDRILQIPLATIENDDLLVWKGEPSSEFTCRQLRSSTVCPKYGLGVETSVHVSRECPVLIELWTYLNLAWVISKPNLGNCEWLTWVFEDGSNKQCRLFCYALWENEALSNRSLTKHFSSLEWRLQENHVVRINFYAAFSQQIFKSASGLVARNERGEVIVSNRFWRIG
ncbi:hypothetical protein Golob_012948, partial [Gossypium lobatum]|nr:hypothetical protein [Gossypium lobatum]